MVIRTTTILFSGLSSPLSTFPEGGGGGGGGGGGVGGGVGSGFPPPGSPVPGLSPLIFKSLLDSKHLSNSNSTFMLNVQIFAKKICHHDLFLNAIENRGCQGVLHTIGRKKYILNSPTLSRISLFPQIKR